MARAPESRPDKEAAKAAVAGVNAVRWIDRKFEPSDEDNISVVTRLRAEGVSNKNGRCTVVFYTAENAKKPKGGSRAGGGSLKRGGTKKPVEYVPTASAEVSKKVYSGVFDAEKNGKCCFYAQCADMVRIDVSDVTAEEDDEIDKDSAPIMAFYRADGTLVAAMNGRKINETGFCGGVLKALGEKGKTARSNELLYLRKLRDVERVAKEQYALGEEINKTIIRIAEERQKEREKSSKDSSRPGSRVSRKLGKVKTKNELKLEEQKSEMEELDEELKEIKEDIQDLVACGSK